RRMGQIAGLIAATAVIGVQRGLRLAYPVLVAISAARRANDLAGTVTAVPANAIVIVFTRLPCRTTLAVGATAIHVRFLPVVLLVPAVRLDARFVRTDLTGAVVVTQASAAGFAARAVGAAAVHPRFARAFFLVDAGLRLANALDAGPLSAVAVYLTSAAILAGLADPTAIDVGLSAVQLAVFAEL